MMKVILVYLGLTYGFSITLSLIIGFTGGQNSPMIGFGILSMFIPALAICILSFTMNEGPRINWNLFPGKYLPLALFLMPFLMHAVMLTMTVMLEGKLPWQKWLTSGADQLFHAPADKGWGAVTATGLIFRITTNAIIGAIVVSFMAFFEELGWRGWLLPRLNEMMGTGSAVLLTSVIWGLWHLPFVFSGILRMGGVGTLETAILAPLGSIAAGLIIGWLWMRTKSIWIVSIAHGAFNNWGQYAFKYMYDFQTADPGIVLLTGSISLLLTGILLLRFCLPQELK